MQEQLSFDVVAPPGPIEDRLFLAFFPTEKAQSEIDSLSRSEQLKHSLGGKRHALERQHITLHHFGDYPGLPPDTVRRAQAAAEQLRCAPFEVKFDRVCTFESSGAYVLTGDNGLAALLEFYERLRASLAQQGIRGVKKTFTPHLTLQYTTNSVPEHAVAPVSWVVAELVLVHSLLNKTTYKILGRWPLSP